MPKITRLVLLPILMWACTTTEVLLPKDAAAPVGIDLAGFWQLRPESLQYQARINDAIDRTDGVDNKTIMREMLQRQGNRDRRRSNGTKGGLVGIFLETGDLLKITQTPYALFISFDRAVVEEYRFGENRAVSIGAADAHRVSGWESDTYVVETLGENGMKLTERYNLAQNNQRLVRRITLRSKQKEEVTIVQVYKRKAN